MDGRTGATGSTSGPGGSAGPLRTPTDPPGAPATTPHGQHHFAPTPVVASQPSSSYGTGGQPSTAPTSGAVAVPPVSASPPAQPSLDDAFREFVYRSCRDTLFWLEAERYRLNPIPQKASFILRTFFTEGGEFCLSKDDFPPQFEFLFSKQRPPVATQTLLEAQDWTKTRLITAMGPSFTMSSLMLKFNTDPDLLGKELATPGMGGTLAGFLAAAFRVSSAPLTPTAAPGSGVLPAASSSSASSTLASVPPSTPSNPALAVQIPEAQLSSSAHVASTPSGDTPAAVGASSTGTATTSSSQPQNGQAPSAAQQSTSSTAPLSPSTAPHAATAGLESGSAQPTTGGSSSDPSGGTSSTNATATNRPAARWQGAPPPSNTSGSPSGASPPPQTQATSSSSNQAGPSLTTSGGVQNAGTPNSASSSSPPTNTGGASSSTQSQPHQQSQGTPISSLPPQSPGAMPTGPTLPRSSSTAGERHTRTTSASRGSLADETFTSTKIAQQQQSQQTTQAKSPAASSSKPSPSTSRINVIQLVTSVKDKVGQAKRDKERQQREKYYDVNVNGWMVMETPTLDDFVHDSSIMIIFYDYLKTIHAEENLACWLDIEFYKASVASRESRRNTGLDILVRYFEPTSKNLINIEGVNYKDILKQLNERPARDLFDGAQRVLWDQLAFQCFNRFKESEVIRRLFEEPTIKGKKKEMLKVAQKAAKGSGDMMAKLEEFTKFKSGFVAFVPNVSEREFQLEDVLYSPELLIAFREYLNTLSNANEYLDALNFWFEVELWKNTPMKDNFKDIAIQIFRDYIVPSSTTSQPRISILGFDPKPLELEVNERPDRNTFMRLQVWAWKKLKLEQFSNFENSETLTKFFDGNLPMRQNLPLVRNCEQLNELRSKNANAVGYRNNLAKVLAKTRAKRQEVQGTSFDLENLLSDKEYVQLLCEFLDKRQARENLAFWCEAEYYKYLTTIGERAAVSNKIWERFFSDKADVHINVDITDRSALAQALKDPNSLSENLFNNCQDTIFTLITYDLMPKFLASEQGSKLVKVSKRRPTGYIPPNFRSGGLQAVKDLRVWVGNVPLDQ